MRQFQQAGEKVKSSQLAQQPPVTSLTIDRLRALTTDELVKLLMSPELAAQPMNSTVRQQIILLLQEREGNDFVRRLLGAPPSEEVAGI